VDADGPSGVHVAMSNTLNTPIEALERELPVLVCEYSLRRGSGGAGAHRGGDGVVRELRALTDMTFSLIAERRRHAPPGAAGGSPGASGRDRLLGSGGADSPDRAEAQGILDGQDDAHDRPGGRLPAKVTGTLHAGERLRIETPGGGGYGVPNTD